jgi:hypothetical protein
VASTHPNRSSSRKINRPKRRKKRKTRSGDVPRIIAKERDIYERPNEEKMKIAEDFKKQGDTAYKLQKLEEADYNYQKVIEKL